MSQSFREVSRRISALGRARSRRSPFALGFTLLEVMVAVAILGLGLTAIFAAQAGALASVTTARNLSQATGLARCKMAEVELDMQKNGLSITDIAEAGPCCDGQLDARLTCAWHIDKPVFPDAKFGDLQLDSKLDLGGLGGTGSGGIGAANLLSGDQPPLQIPSGSSTSDVAQTLGGSTGGIADMLTQLLMSLVYPDLKNVFEAGTRKVTVTVLWNEGTTQRSLEIVQWVCNAQAAGISAAIGNEALDADPNAPTTSSTGAGGLSSGAAGSNFKPPAARTQ